MSYLLLWNRLSQNRTTYRKHLPVSEGQNWGAAWPGRLTWVFHEVPVEVLVGGSSHRKTSLGLEDLLLKWLRG